MEKFYDHSFSSLSDRHQGRRKEFFTGQANQLQSCVYRELMAMSIHKGKILCEAQSACVAC